MGLWPDETTRDADGRLRIEGHALIDLVAEHGSPLYVYSAGTLRRRARAVLSAFRDRLPTTRVVYGGKAFLSPAVIHVLASEGIGLDVVSGGEIHGGLLAGVDPGEMVFHGNCKSASEIERAIEVGVGLIVVDNQDEIDVLDGIAETMYGRRGELRTKVRVMLRLNPGVDVHTHAKIQTGVVDSKFGFPIWTGDAATAVAAVARSARLQLVGYHMHLGSQLHETAAMTEALDKQIAFAADMAGRHGVVPEVLSPGGGLGIAYTEAMDETSAVGWAEAVCSTVTAACGAHGLTVPQLIIEPGRWIVGPSAVALYTVGSIKRIPQVRTYVAVDGGMADNPRPALYQAAYTAEIANRAASGEGEAVRVAGRYCESGDILIDEVALAGVAVGDLLAVPAAGAYQLSMASNYNAVPRPAVVLVDGDEARLIRRRERYEDVFAMEVTS
jgi:diaminopimelate decarboxylase